MVIISEDSVRVADEDTGAYLDLIATGGPDDPIEIRLESENGAIMLGSEDIGDFQKSLVDFMNTGYFNQEG